MNPDNFVIMPQRKTFVLFEKKYGKYEKVKIKLFNIYIPFGIEKYAFKEIINLELKDVNNTGYNNITKIKQLDELMRNKEEISKHDDYFKEQIIDKQYKSCLKEDNNILLRTHTKKQGRVMLTKISKNDEFVPSTDIKGHYCDIELELGNVWTNEYHYGLTFICNNIILK